VTLTTVGDLFTWQVDSLIAEHIYGLCPDCGTYRTGDADHIHRFATHHDRDAFERKQGRIWSPLAAWHQAIDEDAWREVDAEFPDPE